MKHSRSANDSVVVFFALTFLISTPFYILNALAYMNIAGEPEMGAIYIALFTLAPIISASILTYQRRGRQGLKELLGRVVDYKRIPGRRWYLVIILLSPLIFLLSLAGIALFNTAIPPALTPLVALPCALVMVTAIMVTSLVGPPLPGAIQVQKKGVRSNLIQLRRLPGAVVWG